MLEVEYKENTVSRNSAPVHVWANVRSAHRHKDVHTLQRAEAALAFS